MLRCYSLRACGRTQQRSQAQEEISGKERNFMNLKSNFKDRPWKSLRGFGIVKVFRLVVSIGALTPAILSLPFASWAGGVVTNCTEVDLRVAMAGGGTVTFACDGTITLASTITNFSDVVLDGTGGRVTLSGSNAVRVFYNNPGMQLTVRNLTIANGKSSGGAGIFNANGSVKLLGIAFLTNTATAIPELQGDDSLPFGQGGAVFNRGGTVSATNCLFLGNAARQPWGYLGLSAFGGAIRNEAGTIDLESCVFSGNQAYGGPGLNISCACPANPGANGAGGAIHNSGILQVDHCTFVQNAAIGGNCGINYGLATLGGMGGNGAGGAIINLGTAAVSWSMFASNSVTCGNGGPAGPGSQFPDYGYAGGAGGTASGGAICNLGTFTMRGSTVAASRLTAGNGGTGGSGATFTDSGLRGGVGGTGGSAYGGALLSAGPASAVNTTFASNYADPGAGGTGGSGGYGSRWGGVGGAGGNGGDAFGGICDTNGSLSLTNCTVALNWSTVGTGGAGGPGGGSGIHPGPTGPNGTNGIALGGLGPSGGTLVNTLLSTNLPANGSARITDSGHNLSSDGSCTFSNQGSLNNTDPKLGSLAENGGPTLTMALLASSPAIDGADTSAAPLTDQRGFPRPAGLAADIGAFEYGSMLPLLAISRTGATGLDITACGNPGLSCRLLMSTDLWNWVPVATNQIGSEGVVSFQDFCDPGITRRFYRLIMP